MPKSRGAVFVGHEIYRRPAYGTQIGPRALGFAAHPGLKVAMVEDLIMEFEESPANAAPELAKLRSAQRALEDALAPIMTGVVRLAGWMNDPAAAS